MIAVRSHVFRGIHHILNDRKLLSEYNNKCVAYMSCLAFKGIDSDSEQKTVRVQLLCTHGTQGPPDTHLVVKEFVR